MFKAFFTELFNDDVKTILKDKVLYGRLMKKIDEISSHPTHYPFKRYNLKGIRGTHVGSFVILFEIQGEIVVFHRFRHHDKAY